MKKKTVNTSRLVNALNGSTSVRRLDLLKLSINALALAVVALMMLISPASALSGTDIININGKGYGHGVGLSMNGVQHMAERGITYTNILNKYYTGVTVASRSDLMPSKIRVGLYATSSQITITANGSYNIYNYNTGALLGGGSSGQVGKVSYSGSTYTLTLPGSSTTKTYSDPIKFVGVSSSTIMQVTSLTRMSGDTNMNQYRGAIVARYSTNSKTLWAINELGVNQYLYGLAEEPNSWPSEAQKVLAVSSRTYAVEKVRNPSNKYKVDNYDMCPSACQYYLGYLAERSNFRIAVDATSNTLITHPSAPYQVIVAAYSANSGGYTENNEYYWIGQSPLSYLRGVPDSDSEPGNWTVSKTADEMETLLNKSSSTSVNGDLKGFRIDKLGVSGRVVYMTILGTGGDHTNVTGAQFQSALGTGMRSTLFTIGGAPVQPPPAAGQAQLTSVWMHPNPFSPNGDKVEDTTSFCYTLDKTATVTIKVSSYKGEVKTVINAAQRGTGRHYEGWTGTDNSGHILPDGTYSYVITAVAGTAAPTTYKGTVTIKSGAVGTPTPTPSAVQFSSVWMHPNPFYPLGTKASLKTTSFCFTISTTATVTIKVYDYKGEVKTVMANQTRAGGRHYEGWTGTNNSGKVLPPGNYKYIIEAKNSSGITQTSGITSIR